MTTQKAIEQLQSLKKGRRLDSIGEVLDVLSTLEDSYLELAKHHDETFNRAPAAIVTIDRAGKVITHNDHAAEVLLPSNTRTPVYFGALIDPVDKTAYVDFLSRCWDSETPQTRDLRLVRSDGSRGFSRLSARPTPDSNALCLTIIDINDLKESEGRLDAEARRNKALLRETNHRTKNLLQIIRSSLEIKSRSAVSDDARHIAQALRSQVMSLQGAVNALSLGGDVSRVDAAALIGEVVEHLSHGSHDHVSMEFDNQIGALLLSAEAGTSLSLVIAELCFNALEHAFPEGSYDAASGPSGPNRTGSNRIQVALGRRNDHVVATVVDTGIGFDGTASGGGSLGLVIVRDLVESHLRGTIEWIPRHPGTEVRISIPSSGPTEEPT